MTIADKKELRRLIIAKYGTLSHFAIMHNVTRQTVHNWLHTGNMPMRIYSKLIKSK